MSILKLAYLNVIRRKNRSLLTGIITALTILTFVLVFSIFSIVQNGLNLTTERLGADIIVLPNEEDSNSLETLFTGTPKAIYMSKNIESGLKNIKGIEKTTSQFFTSTIDSDECCSYYKTLRLVGINQDSDFILKPWFEKYSVNSLSDSEVIIGSDIQVILGNKISILSHPFKVVGTLYNTGSGMDDTIFMNIDKARLLAKKNFSNNLWNGSTPENLVSSILIKASEGADIEDIVNKINNSNPGVKATSTSSSITMIKEQMTSISKIILFLWLALLLISSLALIGRFNSLAKERKKEIGFLRAMGIHKKDIFKLVISEAWIIAGISGLIGSILGVILVNPALSILEEAVVVPQGQWSLSVSIVNIIIGLVASLILGLLASIYPAWKNSSLAPQEAISKGDIG
ncbi:ABC-type transport system, involved in lipoprotein release, permease component [Gottschalkia purinilytica]|uniref:ABC-type transport system, involved in lipoprotein release, permease component n=1 Tax=Gottschalkia purinilytica TaxID=1503 RepID=A0A0L0WC64_GOTPU|nr:ABC transporter permease [Gottschalkia purinilytica]KNF09057.1 ABC-type transport system, involved in lipoprotein release, permease component [Gottschalkia purinilytica]